FSKVEKARLHRIQQLQREIEALGRKEQQLTGGGAFGSGPPGGGGGKGFGGKGFGGGGGGGGGGAGAGGGFGGGGASSIQELAKAMEQVEKSTSRANDEMNE